MDAAFQAHLNRVYAEHPLTAAAICARLDKSLGRPLPSPTELDLAVDLASGITDQNHVGGLDAVVEISRLLGAFPGASFLDVGSGLGGAARLLAHLCLCKIVGVELTESRYRDAIALTKMVGVDANVQFLCGDFLSVELPQPAFDGVVFLDSFGHFPDKTAVLNRCLQVCRPGGRLVIQDTVLSRLPSPGEIQLLEEFVGLWNVFLVRREDWFPTLNETVRLDEDVDLYVEFRCHFHRLLALESQLSVAVAPREKRAWEIALQLTDAGVLGYRRLAFTRCER